MSEIAASAEDQIAQAYFIGTVATNQNWSADDGAAVTAIDGDAQYSVSWDMDAAETGSSWFLAVVIEPTAADNFTTDTYEDLDVTLDAVYVDGVEITDLSGAVIDTAYYEGRSSVDGVTRIYLRDDWTGTKAAVLEDGTIGSDTSGGNVTAVFTISGTGQEGTDNVTIPEIPATDTDTDTDMDTDTDTDADMTSTLDRGDLDGDGYISIMDASACLNAYANAAAGNDMGLTEDQSAAADIDDDGQITILDAYIILFYYVRQSAGYAVTWDDTSSTEISGETSDYTVDEGTGVITIGNAEVTLGTIEANDYVYNVSLPITVSADYTTLSYGFSLNENLTYCNYSTDSNLRSVQETVENNSYWCAEVSSYEVSDASTLTVTLIAPEDVEVGDTFEITGYLTAPNGTPAILNGEAVSEIVSGTITVVEGDSIDTYKGLSIAVENSIGISEIAYSELGDETIVGVPVTFHAIYALTFGFQLCEGLTYSGCSKAELQTVAAGNGFYWFAGSSSFYGTCIDPTLLITINKSVIDGYIADGTYLTDENTLELPITGVSYAANGSSAMADGQDITVGDGKIIIHLDDSTTTTTTTTTTDTTTTTTTATTYPTADPDNTEIYGDINLDGTISLSDVIALSRYVAGIVVLGDTAKANADVNADGYTDADDALILLKFQVGLVTILPYTD